jgi:hypothetical protein
MLIVCDSEARRVKRNRNIAVRTAIISERKLQYRFSCNFFSLWLYNPVDLGRL